MEDLTAAGFAFGGGLGTKRPRVPLGPLRGRKRPRCCAPARGSASVLASWVSWCLGACDCSSLGPLSVFLSRFRGPEGSPRPALPSSPRLLVVVVVVHVAPSGLGAVAAAPPALALGVRLRPLSFVSPFFGGLESPLGLQASLVPSCPLRCPRSAFGRCFPGS